VQGFIGGQAQALRELRCPWDGSPHVSERSGPASGLYRDIVCDDEYKEAASRLENELVVGHAEYRRVTLKSPHFRRAFAELHRSRSLLFLGSGLREGYFRDLFGEVIGLYGPSPHAHFAVMPEREADCELLERHFGIWVHTISDHPELPKVLEDLAARIGHRPRQVRWRFGSAESSRSGGLSIVRGELPHLAERECLVFSAGGGPIRTRSVRSAAG